MIDQIEQFADALGNAGEFLSNVPVGVWIGLAIIVFGIGIGIAIWKKNKN